MSNARQELGKQGEQLAAEYLESLGYQIAERNYFVHPGELDIIAWDGDCLVFVEVRTRRGHSYVTPEESMTEAKQHKLIESSLTYLQDNLVPNDWRIDFVGIEMSWDGKQVKRINHLQNAVEDWNV